MDERETFSKSAQSHDISSSYAFLELQKKDVSRQKKPFYHQQTDGEAKFDLVVDASSSWSPPHLSFLLILAYVFSSKSLLICPPLQWWKVCEKKNRVPSKMSFFYDKVFSSSVKRHFLASSLSKKFFQQNKNRMSFFALCLSSSSLQNIKKRMRRSSTIFVIYFKISWKEGEKRQCKKTGHEKGNAWNVVSIPSKRCISWRIGEEDGREIVSPNGMSEKRERPEKSRPMQEMNKKKKKESEMTNARDEQ